MVVLTYQNSLSTDPFWMKEMQLSHVRQKVRAGLGLLFYWQIKKGAYKKTSWDESQKQANFFEKLGYLRKIFWWVWRFHSKLFCSQGIIAKQSLRQMKKIITSKCVCGVHLQCISLIFHGLLNSLANDRGIVKSR